MELTVENIGGIDRAAVALEPGVNVLEGRNATNRTSLLQAIMAAFGSERSTLKGDAEEGCVELAAGELTVTRCLRRRNGEVVFDGDAYLEDPELAELFAFLLDENEARRAGRRGEDLRGVIMRPIDTDALRAEIRSLSGEKRELDAEIAELEDLAEERARLETEREEIESTIETREATLADLEAELEGADAASAEGGAMAALRDARASLEEIEYDLETERESRRRLEAERERVESEIADQEDEQRDAPADLADRLEELRERKRAIDTTISELGSVIRFNEERLEEGGLEVEPDDDAGPTDELAEGSLTCWTCGSTVDREAVAETVERLEALHDSKLEERADLESRIEAVTERKEARTAAVERRQRHADRLAEVEAELARTTERIEDLEAARADHRETIAELEAAADGPDGSVLETQRELAQVELELDRHRERLADVEARLDELDGRLAERAALEERRAEVSERLTELRTRIDRIEGEAVTAFNEHMDAILGILSYDNLDRIWIERRETAAGRRTAFDLHVVRSTDDGTTYEDDVAHLSESEREVTGLVFALAGFLAHDVHETVPVMLLDSLEAIDAGRIAALVEYFEEYVDCLVVALLPEDAAALPDEYTYHREF